MSGKRYPRFGGSRRKNAKIPFVCDVCRETIPSESKQYLVDVQWGWFRGDDDVAEICERCHPKKELSRVIASLRKKEGIE